MRCSEDTSIVKFLVAAVCVLDTLHVSFMCHVLYYYLITNYGVATSVNYIVWSFPASVIPNLLVILLVQFFFAHKIHHLCRREVRWLVTVPIILLALAQYGVGIVVAILMFVDKKTSTLTQTWYYSVTPSAAIVVVAEVLITVSLCVLLYNGGSHSSFPRTKRLVNTLITYAVNRCMLTLLVIIGVLTVVRVSFCKMVMSLSHFLQNVSQQPAWTMGLDFIVGKLYANSLLASLNTRDYLWSRGSGAASNPNLSVMRFADPPAPSGDAGRPKDGGKRLDVREVALVGISTESAFSTTTSSQTDVEV
ncbi:hypothetical protein EV401DRAFT_659437 [Pisolithus croceorrhizus]|nr:hypothetical protein EV401DRAFT_659437 [Pisolithus croceorrhizus]